MPLVGFLAEATSADPSAFIETVKGGLGDFSVTNLGIVLVAGLSVTASLAIAWFAYRFIVRKASGAMKKGKL